MGKYDAVMKDLPQLPDENPGYADKVKEAKRTLLAGTVVTLGSIEELPLKLESDRVGELVSTYAVLRQRKEALEDLVKDTNLAIEAILSAATVAYEHDNVQTVKVAGFGALRISKEPLGKIVDPVAFRAWCVRNGLEERLVLPSSSASALVKERLLENLPEPDGTKLYSRPKVEWRRE